MQTSIEQNILLRWLKEWVWMNVWFVLHASSYMFAHLCVFMRVHLHIYLIYLLVINNSIILIGSPTQQDLRNKPKTNKNTFIFFVYVHSCILFILNINTSEHGHASLVVVPLIYKPTFGVVFVFYYMLE